VSASPSIDPLLAELGHRVRAARLAADLSQQQAATKADVDFRYYQRLEKGRINPTVRTLARVAKAFGMTVWDLFCTAPTGAAREPPKVATTKPRRRK
jgi:transcriptional regulator with XRE-family HTH domain